MFVWPMVQKIQRYKFANDCRSKKIILIYFLILEIIVYCHNRMYMPMNQIYCISEFR